MMYDAWTVASQRGCGSPATLWLVSAATFAFREEQRRPAAAMGVQGAAAEEQDRPHLALQKHAAGRRLHVGAIRVDGEREAMAGLEWGVVDGAAPVIDQVTGTDSASGVGLGVDLTDRAFLCVSRMLAHSSEGEDSWQVIMSGALRFAFRGAAPSAAKEMTR